MLNSNSQIVHSPAIVYLRVWWIVCACAPAEPHDQKRTNRRDPDWWCCSDALRGRIQKQSVKSVRTSWWTHAVITHLGCVLRADPSGNSDKQPSDNNAWGVLCPKCVSNVYLCNYVLCVSNRYRSEATISTWSTCSCAPGRPLHTVHEYAVSLKTRAYNTYLT